MVEEHILFVDFVDKIYAKLGVSKDMYEISLSYMPKLNGKMSPFFITTDDDVELLLDFRNEKLCKNPLNVILVPKGVNVNDDIGEDSDKESNNDVEDFCLHEGRGEIHDTFFDVDFLETDEIEVGTSRTKLSVIRNVKAIGVESENGSASGRRYWLSGRRY